jgi:hypothetical protein
MSGKHGPLKRYVFMKSPKLVRNTWLCAYLVYSSGPCMCVCVYSIDLSCDAGWGDIDPGCERQTTQTFSFHVIASRILLDLFNRQLQYVYVRWHIMVIKVICILIVQYIVHEVTSQYTIEIVLPILSSPLLVNFPQLLLKSKGKPVLL